MFDTYISKAGSDGPSHVSVSVTEKRAPTDESVRLLKEMEREAEAKIIASVRVEDSPIDCVVHVAEDFRDCSVRYRAVIKINGRQLVADYDDRSMGRDGEMVVALKVRDAVAEAIADRLMATSWKKAVPLFRNRFGQNLFASNPPRPDAGND